MRFNIRAVHQENIAGLRNELAGLEKSFNFARINRLSKSQYPKNPTLTPRVKRISVPSKLEGGFSRMSFILIFIDNQFWEKFKVIKVKSFILENLFILKYKIEKYF
jgi:hypothetical protein